MPAATFSHLPDDAVERIFLCIELTERHRVLAAVSKRWRQLTLSPQLLRIIEAGFEDNEEERVLSRVRSFSSWLARVAPLGPVEELTLSVVPQDIVVNIEQGGTLTTLAAALAVCGSAGLRRLSLSIKTDDLTLGHWAGMLGSQLRTLVIASREPEFAAPLTALSALEGLVIAGETHWHPEAQLPPSLTKLQLRLNFADDVVLQRVAALTKLQSLELFDCTFDDDNDYEAIVPRLASLRFLTIGSCNLPPTCISRLTSLESLRIVSLRDAGSEEVAQYLRIAVQPLAQLTFLELADVSTADLSALQGLSQLNVLWLRLQNVAHPVQLPGGPWMGCLLDLAAEAGVLACSLASLAAATQLQHLEIHGFSQADGATRGALLQWAGSSTAPLSRIFVDRLPTTSEDAALAAMRAKPGLGIREGFGPL